MTTYFYQYNPETDHALIDTKQGDGYELRAAPVQAESWIKAKKKFGFELTELQKELLKRQEAA